MYTHVTKLLYILLYLQMNDTAYNAYIRDCDTSGPVNSTNQSTTANCSDEQRSLLETMFDQPIPEQTSAADMFFTYFTPVIFTIGLIGNVLSLIVFMSKNMRKLSASIYLAALSISDLMALLFYVLPEWLKHGLPYLPGNHAATFLQEHGTCQLLLYLQYISRFLSSWLVVCFTVERYIGVCHPLRRKDICDPKSASRVILAVIVTASGGCVFKPILSGSYTALNGSPLCTSARHHEHLSFILDILFGIMITLIPFVLITILNLLIIRKLVLRNRRHRKIRIVTEESIIRLEFTFILLALSICFVSLNLPYFSVWCKRYLTNKKLSDMNNAHTNFIFEQNNHMGDLDESLSVTRTIFYTNYCINFFLYSITGAYFRKELKHLFLHKERDYNHYHNCSAHTRSNSHTHTTPQSWV